MIIGSGLIATAFKSRYFDDSDVLIFASGVSNSSEVDLDQFAREKNLLQKSLDSYGGKCIFVYFSTCSIDDPEKINTPYVEHKIKMEMLIKQYSNYLIVRLPQLAGKTPNPNTLLNFLFNEINSGNQFRLYKYAKRNIIDCDDVVLIVQNIIADKVAIDSQIAIVNPSNYSPIEIVRCMEKVLRKRAIYDLIDSGSESKIDSSITEVYANKLGIKFAPPYLENIVRKYYLT